MDIFKNNNDCTGCYACLNVCPKSAINMSYDKNGFLYPKINQKLCIGCDLCKKVCPIMNIPRKEDSLQEYIAYAKNYKTQLSSSSGGIFQNLAEYVLKNDGVVFGVGIDENKTIKHMMVDNIDDLYRIVGTKYVQSEIGYTFSEVKELLNEGKFVLFSGTSCQIAGLKNFLKKDYANLITVDLICHGVPSPLVFKKYLNNISDNNLDNIQTIEFRKKDSNNHKYMFTVNFKNGTKIEEIYNENIYIKGFLNNLYIRPSCFNCHFKDVYRCSDITLGDFWSAEDFYPEFYNIDGNSSVIIHTDKGHRIFDKIQNMTNYMSTDLKKITKWNDCFYKSVKPSGAYEIFLEDYLKTERIIDLIGKCIMLDSVNKKKSNKYLSKTIMKIKEILKCSKE